MYGKYSLRYLGLIIWSKLNLNIGDSRDLGMSISEIRKLSDISNMVSIEKCKIIPATNDKYLCYIGV